MSKGEQVQSCGRRNGLTEKKEERVGRCLPKPQGRAFSGNQDDRTDN